jgi:hypothetical protein
VALCGKGFQRAGVVVGFVFELTILNFCQGLSREPFHTRSHFTTSSVAFAIYGSLHSTFAVPFHHKVHSNSIISHSFTATPSISFTVGIGSFGCHSIFVIQ